MNSLTTDLTLQFNAFLFIAPNIIIYTLDTALRPRKVSKVTVSWSPPAGLYLLYTQCCKNIVFQVNKLTTKNIVFIETELVIK